MGNHRRIKVALPPDVMWTVIICLKYLLSTLPPGGEYRRKLEFAVKQMEAASREEVS